MSSVYEPNKFNKTDATLFGGNQNSYLNQTKWGEITVRHYKIFGLNKCL